jgi:hypothetical protein
VAWERLELQEVLEHQAVAVLLGVKEHLVVEVRREVVEHLVVVVLLVVKEHLVVEVLLVVKEHLVVEVLLVAKEHLVVVVLPAVVVLLVAEVQTKILGHQAVEVVVEEVEVLMKLLGLMKMLEHPAVVEGVVVVEEYSFFI